MQCKCNACNEEFQIKYNNMEKTHPDFCPFCGEIGSCDLIKLKEESQC